MKPVDQAVVDKDAGDCWRAAVASLLELPLEAVPHFNLNNREGEASTAWDVFFYFLWAHGWEWKGTGYPASERPLTQYPAVGGFIEATVPSKTYSDRTHAVIIDLAGVVVHDPNPNKLWQGVNVVETGELKHWAIIQAREGYEHKVVIDTDYLREDLKVLINDGSNS